MAPTPVPPSAPLPTSAADEDSVWATSRAELEAADRLGTSQAKVALKLAARLDAEVRESGMGLSAVVREHRAAMAEAVKGAKVAADPVDEFTARRLGKVAGA